MQIVYTDDDWILFHELRNWGVPYSRAHINRLIHEGTFPAPVQLNPLVGKHGSRKAWRVSDLRAWRKRHLAGYAVADTGGEAA